MLSIKTILHPTDFSLRSKYAFQLADSLARDYSAQLLVLHVASPPIIAFGEGVVPPDPAATQQQLRTELEQVRPRDASVRVKHLFREGDAVAEILRAVQESKVDLIIMGTHGRTGLGRMLMGSVAEQVMRNASCPVMTIKTP